MLREDIYKRILEFGLTQKQICDELGLCPQNFNGFIRGSRPIPYDDLVQTLRFLKLGLGFSEYSFTSIPPEEMHIAVKERMASIGYRIQDAVALTHINKSVLSSFISGKRNISIRNLEILMNSLQLSLKPLKRKKA